MKQYGICESYGKQNIALKAFKRINKALTKRKGYFGIAMTKRLNKELRMAGIRD